jgi:CMP-N-acetylneuraminic acid synthetase
MTISDKKALAIIPARGGSKRIPRKNIKPFLGKPIMEYSIQAARACKCFDEIMVSTDDKEIAEIAISAGAQVPFFRSTEASSDTAGTAEVLIEVLYEYEKRGMYFEYLCCIYPTAPFITAQRLSYAKSLLMENNVDCILPVTKFSYPIQVRVITSGTLNTLPKPTFKNLKREDGLLISKIYYFQPILANCRVDITIFILYRGLYWIEPVGAWCRINNGPICCYSFPAVTQPCQP